MANSGYVSKVVYHDRTIVDLTGDTVTAAKLGTGVTAHDASGAPIVGTMPTPSTVYSGASVPSSSLGVNGDIYVKLN